MILPALVLAGTLVAQLCSRQLSSQKDRQAEPSDPTLGDRTQEVLDTVYVKGETFVKRALGVTAPESRPADGSQPQTAQLMPGEDESERPLRNQVVIASSALALNLAGAVTLPALTLLSLPALAYVTGSVVLSGTRYAVRKRRLGMPVLEALSVGGMFVTGHFFVLAATATLFAGGSLVANRTRDRSEKQLTNIIDGLPRMVWLLVDGEEVLVPVGKIGQGDRIVVHAGEMITVDGETEHGTAMVDQHTLTGESQPASKSPGDSTLAGTIVLSGQIIVRVEQAGSETVAANIAQILAETSDYRSTLELRGDAIADRSVLPSLGIAGLLYAWRGPVSAVASLTCSIGLHIRYTGPISVLNYLNIASAQGIFIKDGRALEQVSGVDTLIFDKTGTLTDAKPRLVAVHAIADLDENDVLRLAAAAESHQSHPIAEATRKGAAERSLVVPPVSESHVEPGFGLRVEIEGSTVWVGSRRFMTREGVELPAAAVETIERCHRRGSTAIAVAVGGHVVGILELCASLQPGSRELVAELDRRGIEVWMISGDHEQPTRRIAEELGIHHFVAEALPTDKSSTIRQLQADGRRVCFVGDGINDSIALKQADVSISMRGATMIAQDTAQILIDEHRIESIAELLRLSEAFERNMQLNLAASTIPGVVSLAGIVFFGTGVATAGFLAASGFTLGLVNAIGPAMKRRDTSETGVDA
jgi:heavy metal translocating P-type ATPase